MEKLEQLKLEVELLRDLLSDRYAAVKQQGEELNSIEQPKNSAVIWSRDGTEIFRIVPTAAGWDVVLNPARTMTEAAQCFIEAVNNLQRHPLPPAPKEEK
jgi:hypothetical protein